MWEHKDSDSANGTKAKSSLEAAFAMFFLGLLANTAQIAAFLVELIGPPRSLGRMAAAATGVAMFLFYMIGFSVAVGGPADLMDEISANLKDPLAPGASVGLWIVAWIGSMVTIALAFLWKVDDAEVTSTDVECAATPAPSNSATVAPAPSDGAAAAPPCDAIGAESTDKECAATPAPSNGHLSLYVATWTWW